jgi:DNA-binding NtrC family response regulator
MKRFNLLLVTKDASLRPIALKSLSKVFSSNFVFELASLDEATHLLSKLHIDVLMLDLDMSDFDLVALSKRWPTVKVMGVAAHPHANKSNISPLSHKVFEKRDFAVSFAAELKVQRKGIDAATHTPAKVRRQEPAASKDFVDFFSLTRTK